MLEEEETEMSPKITETSASDEELTEEEIKKAKAFLKELGYEPPEQ